MTDREEARERAIDEAYEKALRTASERALPPDRAVAVGVHLGFDAGCEYAAGRWVPCSERLPEEPDWGAQAYIVAYESERARGIVTVPARFRNGQFHWADASALPIDTDYRQVIAWMPIPPYRQGGSE